MSLSAIGRYWRRLSVGVVIAALLIAAVAPLAVVNLVLIWEAKDEAIERRGAVLRNAVLRAGSLNDLALRTVDSALAADPLALSVVIGDREACRDFLNRRLVDHPFISAAVIIARQGRVLCASEGGNVGIDLSDRAYFRAAMERPGLTVEEPVYARPSGRLILPVARRLEGFVTGHGSPDEPAILAAAFDLDAFVQLIKGRSGTESDEATLRGVDIRVVDRRGVILVDLNGPTRTGTIMPFPIGEQFPVAVPQLVAGYGGDTLLTVVGPELPGGIRVVLNQALHAVVADPQRRLLASAVTALLALLVGLGTAYLLVKRLVLKPLGELRDMAARLERDATIPEAASRRFLGELESLRQSFVGMAKVVLLREQNLRSQSEMLADLAHRDPLTGVANRRGLDDAMQIIWANARLRREPVSALFLDVDHFKAFNDRYGHRAGDEALRKVAQALLTLPLRAHDLVARYGGEEFVVALPKANVTGAKAVAERAREAIERLSIPHADSPTGFVTVSVGVASAWPEADGGVERLLSQADAALYAAKQAGRNRVRTAEMQDAGLV